MNKIVILTPTYNRLNKLPKLYESLVEQSNKLFDWWIIDDGSTDSTREYVDKIKKENKVSIRYIYQENGGKARALNNGFRSCEYASVFVIVDSDDYLLPSAISTVAKYLNKYINCSEVGAFFFYYKTEDGQIIKPSGEIIENDVIMNRYEYNKKYKANDGCVCYFNKAVKKFIYPEFKGEKYVGPTVIQMEMADEYKIVFSPEVIGIAEYQKDGLTHSGRKLRIKNPLGMIYYSGLQQSKHSTIKDRIKHSIGAQAYRFFSGNDRDSLSRAGLTKYLQGWAFVPGMILKSYWQLKSEKGKK